VDVVKCRGGFSVSLLSVVTESPFNLRWCYLFLFFSFFLSFFLPFLRPFKVECSRDGVHFSYGEEAHLLAVVSGGWVLYQ